MSWNTLRTIARSQPSAQIEADIERLFDFTDISKTQPHASKVQVNAVVAAAKALQGAVFVPFGQNLWVCASGHSQAREPGSMTDSITVTVCATTQPPDLISEPQ